MEKPKKILNFIIAALIIKQIDFLDFKQKLLKINENYFLSLNPSKFYLHSIYHTIPLKNILSPICDYFVSKKLNSFEYFILSLLFPQSKSSFEIFLLTFNSNYYFDDLLVLINPYNIFYCKNSSFWPILFCFKEMYDESHFVSLNCFWFFHLNMFEQYSLYFYKVIFVIGFYVSRITKYPIFVSTLLKPFDERNLFFLYFYYKLKYGVLYFLMIILYLYFTYKTYLNGTINLNFVNWCCFAVNVGILVEFFYLQKIKSKK